MAVTLLFCCPFFQKVGGLFTISLFLFLPAKEILSELVVYLLLLEIHLLIGVYTIVLIDLFVNGIFCWLTVDGSLHGLFRSFTTLRQILSLFRLWSLFAPKVGFIEVIAMFDLVLDDQSFTIRFFYDRIALIILSRFVSMPQLRFFLEDITPLTLYLLP